MSHRDHLAHRMNVLRTLIKSPHRPFAMTTNKVGAFALMPQVGYLGCTHAQYSGYRVFEITNDSGGERNLAEGLTVHECINFVNGAVLALEGRLRMFGSPADD